jgi:predicted MFS family arabinose efflux permease
MTSSSPSSARAAEPSKPSPPPFPWVGLIALAAGTFLSVTGEMIPTGLLPEMSTSLGVTESQIGLLVSVFAFTVVLSSTALIHLTRRVPRHALLVAVIVVLGVSTGLGALAPNYELLVATRVLGGLAHGVFWAVVGAYAGHLVPNEQLARAVSVTIAGGTLAFVLGVPLSTALGHALGWRLAFGVLAAAMLLGAVVVGVALEYFKLEFGDTQFHLIATGILLGIVVLFMPDGVIPAVRNLVTRKSDQASIREVTAGELLEQNEKRTADAAAKETSA